MKKNTLLFSLALLLGSLPAAFSQVNTSGDNSPAVIAKNFSAQYDVRPDAILAVLWVYEQEGYDPQERKRRTEAVIKMYKETPEKKQRAAQLSDATKTQLGLSPALSDALDWDLFARKNYLSLSTTGANSPAVVAGSDVNIWYGIPPKVVRALADFLEKNKVDIADLEKRLGEQVKKYEELKAEFETYGPTDPIVKKAEQLLEEGKLLEVEKLLDSNLEMEDKRLAYRHYLAGETKELLLKYDIAAIHFQKALVLDPQNSKYLSAYAVNEVTRAHYDEAIEYFQKALAIDTIVFKGQPEKAAVLYNYLGSAWKAKGEYDFAIDYQEKALAIYIRVLGEKHPNVAQCYDDIGWVWEDKGDYDRALEYYEKALTIDYAVFGNKHPNVAVRYNNIGLLWHNKGEYDLAIGYYEKALPIYIREFGEKDPSIAACYNNFGLTWKYKGKYDRAIYYYEKALAIDSVVFGNKHPEIATGFNNLGSAWQDKGENDRAIDYYEKALAIDYAVFGNKHPNVAVRYNNLGMAWQDKGEYDRAIDYYEKALSISVQFLGWGHPKTQTTAQNLSHAANEQGLELLDEKKYAEALLYFQKALGNAEYAQNWALSLTCLYNIGVSQKEMKRYAEGLAALEKGLTRAEQSNELKYMPLLRWMRYEKAGCLVALNREKEAKKIYQQLLQEAIEAKDFRLLEDLKNDGVKE